MKVITIIGARPQFVKAAVLSRQFEQLANKKVEEIIIHTGQHFDHNMSQVFFDELEIPPPKYNLNIHGASHAHMTGKMLIALEDILKNEQPDCVILYGDTNSTLAGALAASKLHIPIAHVEAGLRSFNKAMPEEINRVLTDNVSDLLFCPTQAAQKNLEREGFANGIHISGDIMLDSFLYYQNKIQHTALSALKTMGIGDSPFVLTTIHRAENTKDSSKMREILDALVSINQEVSIVLPLHPATREKIVHFKLEEKLNSLTIIPPTTYSEMMALLSHCQCVITDSGGLQKEAYFAKKACLTIRDETEWTETAELGHNCLTPCDSVLIQQNFAKQANAQFSSWPSHYGNGNSAEIITDILVRQFSER